MNKRVVLVIGILISIMAIGGGIFAFRVSGNDSPQEQIVDANSSSVDNTTTTNESTTTPTNASSMGTYVTLADYDANPENYANSKKVYFFHASWCPICQSIDKEISSDTSKIPAGVTIIKTDFDSSKNLRQKYGVTLQYTFVQVDSNGNEVAQWSATSLDKAIAGIES